MKVLTDWYPPEIRPVREGAYLARVASVRWDNGEILLWDGEHWAYGDGRISPFSYLEWRGLAFDPETAFPVVTRDSSMNVVRNNLWVVQVAE